MHLRKQSEKPKKRRTNAYESIQSGSAAVDDERVGSHDDKHENKNNNAEKDRPLLPSPKAGRQKKRTRSDLVEARARRSRLKPRND